MSYSNDISKLINIKDKNIHFEENCVNFKEINGITCKIIKARLTYVPHYCEKCGAVFNKEQTYEKNGFRISKILLSPSCEYKTILELEKQRFLCHVCNKKFFAKTSIVRDNCFISNDIKYAIANSLRNKISEKDIGKKFFVSSNTVERIIDSYYENKKLYKHYLPDVLSFDEFKSVKSADGAMSFHLVDGKTGTTIDIVENRQLPKLLQYFSYYTHKARANVKFIVIDMYSPYISLINKMFPNAKIIIDKFHLVNLVSTAMNKTRIKTITKSNKNYRKFKKYWKLILKDKDDLNYENYKKSRCFNKLMTQYDIVQFLINSDEVIKENYNIYQNILYSLKHNDLDLLKSTLFKEYKYISSYMLTSIKTLIKYLPYIYNTLKNKYHNGFVEGNNNFIKTIKRIAFGFRSFFRFKARIMICMNLVKRKANV